MNKYIDIVILFGFPLLIIAVFRIISKGWVKISSGQAIFFIGFVLFCSWSLISYFWVGQSEDSTRKIIQMVFIGGSSILIIKGLFNDRSKIERFLIISVVIGIVFGSYELLKIKHHLSVQPLGGEGGYQWLSLITYVAFVISLVYMLHFNVISKKVSLFLILFILLFGMIKGGARQAVFASLFSILYLFYLYIFSGGLRKLNIKQFWIYTISGFFITCFIYLTFKTQLEILLNTRGANRIFKFLNLTFFGDIASISELSGRSVVFSDAWHIFMQKPILGCGFGAFRDYASTNIWSHPHNVFLEVLSELGIIGLILFMIIIIPVLLKLLNVNLVKNSIHLRVLGAIIIGYLAIMMTSGNLGSNRLLFAFITMFLIAYHREKIRKRYLHNKSFSAKINMTNLYGKKH
ncbi:MAG: O-antigen ligase family protein [Petrotogales bacterium]